MSVVTIPYTMNVPKECKEIVDAEAGIIKHFRMGGDLAGAAAFLPAIMAAVQDYDKVPEELRSNYKDEAAGYLVHKTWEALDSEAPVVNPVAKS